MFIKSLLILGVAAASVSSNVVPTSLASGSSSAEIPTFLVTGSCAKVQLQEKFDLRRYEGRWYQTEILENNFQPFTKCINSFYDYSKADHGFKVTTAGFNAENEQSQMEGKVYTTEENPSAHMLLDFPSVLGNPYQVVETDYNTYSCVYSCIDWNTYKTEFAFVFSRTPDNGGPATDKCAEVFKKNGVDFSKFIAVPQTADCVYRA